MKQQAKTCAKVVVNVKAGTAYMWCSCGLSEQAPFCDGSHYGTEFRPVFYKAKQTEQVYFCGCRKTQQPPMCDDHCD